MQRRILNMLGASLLLSSVPAIGATRYVAPEGTGDGSSWASAMADLQEAIDASETGDQIWVAAGTYHPTKLIKSNKATSKAFMLKDGVSIYGGFEGTETSTDQRKTGDKPYDMTHATILSADDDVADVWTRGNDGISNVWGWEYESNNNINGTSKNSSHVLYSASTIASPTVIDGLTLTGANANVATAKPSGGAVYAPGNVRVTNCRILENSAYFTGEANDCNSYGAGVYLNGGSIDNCYIARAYAHSSYGQGIGGGVYILDGTVEDCVFEDCVATDGGGAVYMRGGSLKNCSFSGCYASKGGAIYNNGGTIDGVTIIDSKALHGGGIFNAGTVKNAVVAGCYADYEAYDDGMTMGGGGIYNYSGDIAGAAVYNCTSWRGGGVYLASGRLINATVQNNTERDANGASANVYGDAASVLNTISAADAAASNFIAPTAKAGSKEISRAALEAADWSLAPGSAYIDAGTPVEGYADGYDLAGNPRVAGAAIDCGAYEAQGGERVPTITLTFAEGTESARIGVGITAGSTFSIDWGNGEEVTYESEGYMTGDIKGSSVKLYGDDIIQIIANSQNVATADFSRAEKMIRIQMAGNAMTSLVLGNHPDLDGIYAGENMLSALNVAGCPGIKVLDVHSNRLTGTVDCSAMYRLSKVDISGNRCTGLILPEASTVYDVDCSDNAIETLEAVNLTGLNELSCYENELTSLTLTNLPALEELNAYTNRLSSIDLSGCPALTKVSLAENLFESVDLSKNTNLEGIYVQGNKLTSLDLSANKSARYVNVSDNALETLDVKSQPNLSLLNASGNKISSIDVTGNTRLSTLELANNKLSDLDVTAHAYLSTLNVAGNLFSTLDLSKCGYLFSLDVSNNNFAELSLGSNPYLYYLYCANNSLTKLDLSGNAMLWRIEAQGNKLSNLDVSGHVNLRELLLQSNLLDADALAEIISDLPTVDYDVDDTNKDWMRQLNISYNPGTAAADAEAAAAKGWFVTADFDNPGAETAITDLNLQIIRSENAYYETSAAEIVYGNDDHTLINFENFMGTGARVVATLDENGTVAIAPQMCGGDSEGNYLMIVNAESTDGLPFEIYNTRLYGTFDGKELTLDPWNLIIVPTSFTENLGTYYPENVTSTFVKANSKMEYTVADGATIELPVYAEDSGKGTVEVFGWGRYAKVTLEKIDSNWAINPENRAYYMEGAEFAVVSPEGTEVVSTEVPDARNVVFGAWQFQDMATGRIAGDYTSAKLTLGFDLPAGTGTGNFGMEAEVESTIYYNAAGASADVPFKGFNIRVDTLRDGSSRTTKMVVK